MHQKEAVKRVVVVSIVVLLAIVSVSLMFYYAPDRAVVGEAVLTSGEVAAVLEESVDNPNNLFVDGQYALGKYFENLAMAECPPGNFVAQSSGSQGGGAPTFCVLNPLVTDTEVTTGWELIELTELSQVKEIRLEVENAGDGCSGGGSNCLDVFTSMFISSNYDSSNGDATVWTGVGAGETYLGEREFLRIVLPTAQDVKAILIGAITYGGSNIRWHSIELLQECTTNGEIVTQGSVRKICIDGLLESITCSASDRGRSYANLAYCNPTNSQWTNSCTANTYSTAINKNHGTRWGPHCCPTGNCVGSGASPLCFAPGLIAVTDNEIMCKNSNMIYCTNNKRGTIEATEAGDEYYCKNQMWHPIDYECDSNKAGEVEGPSYCNGERWVSCGSESNKICKGSTTSLCESTRNGQIEPVGDKQYYCSAKSSNAAWVLCNESTLGEGIYSGDRHNLYNDMFVCSKEISGSSVSYKWLPTNCQVCAGDLAGECTGSDLIKINSNPLDVLHYYDVWANYRIGCTINEECFYDSDIADFTNMDNFGYDEKHDEFPYYVCGDEHNILSCTPALDATYLASDGKRWLCDPIANPQSPEWLECSENRNANVQKGSYQCTTVNGVWQWFSEFACGPTDKYKLRDNGRNMCYGGRWLTCGDVDHTTFEAARGVRINCNNNVFVTEELNCLDDRDNDEDGLKDCADPDCYGEIGNGLTDITDRFMVSIEKYGCRTDTQVKLRNPQRESQTTLDITNLELCDTHGEGMSSRATLCYTFNDDLVENIKSIRTLRNANEPPQSKLLLPGLNFIYSEPSQGSAKQIHLVYVEDISDGDDYNFPMRTFVDNLNNGQFLMLKLGTEHYLLSYPQEEEIFSLDKLDLKHVPQEFAYEPVIYRGTDSYVFTVEGNRQIVIKVVDEEIIINSLRPGEVPAGYVTPKNLDEEFEVVFTQDTPARIVNPDLGVLTICREDNPADHEQALLCNEGERIYSLRKDTLAMVNLPDPTDNTDTRFALLYQRKNNQKQISLFKLEDLDDSYTTAKRLDYDKFTAAMVNGTRAAFNFAGTVYLAEHPAGNLSLTKIKFVDYKHDGRVEYVASGSEDSVQFLPETGRITLTRLYGVVAEPLEIRGETRQQMIDNPIDLDRELFASMSNKMPVKITAPNFGIISAAPEDLKDFEGRFDLRADQGNLGTAGTLNFKGPKWLEVGGRKVLFYYHSAEEVPQKDPIKTVSIYRMYDLTEELAKRKRALNNDFLEVFTKGNELALKFHDSFYLLGYQGASGSRQLFRLEKLTLRNIDGTSAGEVRVDGNKASFNVQEGEISVEITSGDEIIFSREEQLQWARDEFLQRYSFVLTTTNEIEIDGLTFSLCNKNIYGRTTAANICYGNSDVVVEAVKVIHVRNKPYLLEVNGFTGEQKEVTVRRLYNIDDQQSVFPYQGVYLPPSGENTLNWGFFSTRLAANDLPVFNISGGLYLPSLSGTDHLTGLVLYPYDGSWGSVARNVEEKTPVTYKAHFVVGENRDRVLKIDQTVDQSTPLRERKIKTELSLLPNSYVPEEFDRFVLMNLTSNTIRATEFNTRPFYAVVGGNLYRLIVGEADNPNFVTVTVKKGNNVIITTLMRRDNSRIIYLDNAPVEIKVRNLKNLNGNLQFVEVTLKRIR